MPIAALSLCTLSCNGDMFLTCFLQGFHFHGGWIFAPKCLDEFYGLGRHRADCFGAAMEIDFRGCGFVGAFYAAIEAVVCGLECHLDESIRGKAHGCYEVLAIGGEVESLEFVLLD